MGIKPFSDKVLIKPISGPETTKGGIIIPETVSSDDMKAQEGEVLAVGTGRLQKDGSVIPLIAKKGDRVIFLDHGATEVSVEGEDCFLLEEYSILAILES
ncbi:MAG: co-chaperone GroES [Candidatus Dadabacteria bacterium]|nr:MAG: co-chaperone GroES [Candidatus Dadabacteria bacterium]TDJ01856.1 MAG: co-chaperone GroES [Candidatus Dadabacteria bacterium]